MNEDMLKQLVERTFSKLANPAKGFGMYAELQKAIMLAYHLGKNEAEHLMQDVVNSFSQTHQLQQSEYRAA